MFSRGRSGAVFLEKLGGDESAVFGREDAYLRHAGVRKGLHFTHPLLLLLVGVYISEQVNRSAPGGGWVTQFHRSAQERLLFQSPA